MTTITTQKQPKSIAALSPTPTNTSPETVLERVFFNARLRMHSQHLLLEEKNTMASNSDCLQASENTINSHKHIFIQPWLAWVRLSWRI